MISFFCIQSPCPCAQHYQCNGLLGFTILGAIGIPQQHQAIAASQAEFGTCQGLGLDIIQHHPTLRH